MTAAYVTGRDQISRYVTSIFFTLGDVKVLKFDHRFKVFSM